MTYNFLSSFEHLPTVYEKKKLKIDRFFMHKSHVL